MGVARCASVKLKSTFGGRGNLSLIIHLSDSMLTDNIAEFAAPWALSRCQPTPYLGNQERDSMRESDQ